ncbi:MAG: SusC/RagA family TonB-linked outer membrane protein [Sphingobacteriales bacterium]|jgi:TonB-linked SusC/RagA family outer membrane protein
MRKLLSLLCAMMLMVHFAVGQTLEVSGKVSDENGNPVSGASVVDKATKVGTTTDAQGNFKLTARRGATLVISYVGFDSREILANTSDFQGIQLKGANQALSEVVVTAQGIRREKKALGYAVASVDKKQLELRPENDVVRLLNGKAPGVNILPPSGMSGSGTNIIIRGVNTITGGSTPLFIVDGVPFDASTNAQAGFQYGNTTSSRFLDLDPNNIENISVLKGLSATTLYGELGRNGVVMVTTKNGANRRTAKKTEITLSQSLFVNKVANLPEYQNTYGSGFDMSSGLAFFSNWGAPFKTPPDSVAHPYSAARYNGSLPQYIGAKYALEPKNSVEKFFRTGLIRTTSVNLATSLGNGSSLSANYGYTDDEGFTPGNRLIKNTFGIGGTAKLSNKFTFMGTFNYALTDFKSPPTSTSFGSNPTTSSVFGNLMYTPRAVDIQGLEYEDPSTKGSIYYRPGNDIQHPLWTVNNSFVGQKVNRLFGNMSLRYDISNNWNVMYRVGYDNYSDYNYLSQNKGGVVGGNDYQLGIHRTVTGVNQIWDHSLITQYNTKFGNDFRLGITAGANSQERLYSQQGQRSTQQLVYGLFDHDNFIVHDNNTEDGGRIDFQTKTLSLGVFAQAELAYKEWMYVTIGGRQGWSSNLEKANRSLFYPSVNASFIPTAAFEGLKGNSTLNFLKFRAGYSTSANFGDPYNTRPILSINTNAFALRDGTIINSNTISNLLPNPNLKPELQQEVEFGTEGRMFNNRFSFDVTWYNRVSSDQILRRDLDPSTGFTATFINAGNLRNRGWEIQLGITPIRTRNFQWEITANYTRNRNLVYDLPDEVKQIVIDGFTNEGLFALNNYPLGVIQGSFALRDSGTTAVSSKPTGERIVDNNGNYITSNRLGIIGDPNPDFVSSLINTLTWKGLSLRFQFDYTQGGDMMAYTPGTLTGRGLTKDVGPEAGLDRFDGVILPGVKQNGTPNDIQITSSEAYFNNLSGFFGMGDLIVYDATVVRLREASLSYNFPQEWFRKLPFGGASITFSGQNLWYNAPNFPKYVNFDPETSSLGVSNVRGLEYLSGPTSKRYGVSVRVSF